MSAVSGGTLWFFCNHLYSIYRLKISGFLMVPALCTLLFAVLFLTIWAGSVLTDSFDRENFLYSGPRSMLKYFTCGIAGIFCLTMLLEYLYELNPSKKIIEPTSYIFVIDESGSMSGNDPEGLRYDAVSEIMNSTDSQLPYMVYAFSSESKILRDMGPMTANEAAFTVTCDGATSIYETTLRILKDYKDAKWNGGTHPKIIFLTDGFATDLDNGFLWFKGNVPEFNAALEEYNQLGINISTVGLGSVDKNLMKKMAEITGGVFIPVKQASDLAEAMKTAATSYSTRDLLSVRYMNHFNTLFGFLRVIFLSLIGLLIGGLLSLPYMDHASIPLIVSSSAAGSLLGSVLLESGVQSGVYQSILWFLLWILFSATLGFLHPKKQIWSPGNMTVPWMLKNKQMSEMKNGNIRV